VALKRNLILNDIAAVPSGFNNGCVGSILLKKGSILVVERYFGIMPFDKPIDT